MGRRTRKASPAVQTEEAPIQEVGLSVDEMTDEQRDLVIAEQRAVFIEAMNKMHQEYLDESMGTLHNQFVAFISAAKIPLPNALLVLKIVEREIVDQAIAQYMGK